MNKLKLHNLISSPWILVVLMLLVLTSCATSIKFPVERPAEIDSKGANSIAVLPFSSGNMLPFYFNHNADSKVIVNYIQEQFQKKILSSGFFTLIAAQGLPKDGKPNTDAAYDLYIHGNIYNFSNKVEKILVESEDKKKKEYIFKRKVSLSVKYQVVYTQTGEILYTTTQHIEEESSEYATERELPDFFSLISSDLNSRITTITKKLMPYTTTRSLSLLNYKTKDEATKEAMKTAQQLAKDRYYSQAQQAYLNIYEQQGIFEAGYNAALLLEATGKLKEAEELMSQLLFSTSNKDASKALQAIQQEIRYSDRLQYQLNAQKLSAQKTKAPEESSEAIIQN